MTPTFKELTGAEPSNEQKPPLDRLFPMCNSQEEYDWVNNGVVCKRNFIPPTLLEAYCRIRDPMGPLGWHYPTPYMDHAEILNIGLFPELAGLLQTLIGEPMGMHLNLPDYVSTERAWHQDDYLNPDFVNAHYAAVWMALDDVHPDSGPFQYVAGSHRWPAIRYSQVMNAAAEMGQSLDPQTWPRQTEGWVGKACEDEIKARGADITTFLPKKGDVLVWHGRLMHRGSVANTPGMERKSLISHYSGIYHRPDMPTPQKYGLGYFFPLSTKAAYQK